jgi:predicted alpha/beta-hydrolase family hydrolase
VFAHGAGAGMAHPFMAAAAQGLAERGIASLRYQFPYMERRSKRVDPPKVAHAAVRAAVAQARRQLPDLPLIAGGKSFGGRMTSQAQAAAPLDGVVGLAFLGFPLHPPGRPSRERGEHLADVKIPMLFLQGTRDEFAALNELEPVVKALGSRATLKLLRMPIIPSMCRRAAAARMPTCAPRCSMRWPNGSRGRRSRMSEAKSGAGQSR